MKLKDELYKEEQKNIINNIINILELDNENSITLYELDNNDNKKKQIMDLIPTIKQYFNCNKIKGVIDPENVKRPYLSIIRRITKGSYNIYHSDIRYMIDNKYIRTKKYVFVKKISA